MIGFLSGGSAKKAVTMASPPLGHPAMPSAKGRPVSFDDGADGATTAPNPH